MAALLAGSACTGSGGADTEATGTSTTVTGETPTTGTASETAPTGTGPGPNTATTSGTSSTATTASTASTTTTETSTSVSTSEPGDSSTGPAPDLGGATNGEEETDTGAAQCPPPLEQPPGSWTSELVPVGADDALQYVADDQGNRIPDFSYAGYHRAEAPIPDVPTVTKIGPIANDNTKHIQDAIDMVGAMPLGADGFRGAVELEPGTYNINGTILLRHSGVVLRGAGDGEDPATSTILRAVGDTPHQRDVLVVGSGSNNKWAPEVADTRTDIVSDRVEVGERELEVAEPENFAVGDHVVIFHPCTAKWLTAIDGGGTEDDADWGPNSLPIVYKRQIMAIDGAKLTIDAPVYNHLDRALSQSYMYKLDRKNILTELGVEDLRIDIQTKGGTDENHAWNAISMRGLEDGWVRRFTALHFGHSAVIVQTGTQITVADSRGLDPVAQITGERMYNFDVSNAQQVLFTGCHASKGRHHFVSNGTTWTSGIVFHRSTSTGAYAMSEGHRQWSTGMLYDNIVESDPSKDGITLIALYNHGHYGTSHGWANAHSVAWNYDVSTGRGLIQRPPTAQNYAIGGAGTFAGTKPPAPFDQPEGHIEGVNKPGLVPESLYDRQLAERLCGMR